MDDRVEVLIAALECNPEQLVSKMNIQTDAILANQCSENSIFDFSYRGCLIKTLNFCERGVGLNRNNALMRATGDFCLIADDDMVYVDNYKDIVVHSFRENPDADVIVYNLIEKMPSRYFIKRKHHVHFYNFLRYGTARIAFRLSSVRKANIFFHMQYGGGTEHSHGEDNIFLSDCLKHGLKIVALPVVIAELNDDRPSTWNTGFTDKYFYDQGSLYRSVSRHFWFLLCFQDVLRHSNKYKRPLFQVLNLMIKGGLSV